MTPYCHQQENILPITIYTSINSLIFLYCCRGYYCRKL